MGSLWAGLPRLFKAGMGVEGTDLSPLPFTVLGRTEARGLEP